MTPASPIGPVSSVISRSSGSSVRVTSSRVVSFSPGSARRTTIGAGKLVAVVAVDRLAELEHHVVGDVDGQRDRPHAGQLQPRGHPRAASAPPGRGRSPCGSTKTGAAVRGVGDAHRVAVRVRRRHVAQRRPGRGRRRRRRCAASRATPRMDSA